MPIAAGLWGLLAITAVMIALHVVVRRSSPGSCPSSPPSSSSPSRSTGPWRGSASTPAGAGGPATCAPTSARRSGRSTPPSASPSSSSRCRSSASSLLVVEVLHLPVRSEHRGPVGIRRPGALPDAGGGGHRGRPDRGGALLPWAAAQRPALAAGPGGRRRRAGRRLRCLPRRPGLRLGQHRARRDPRRPSGWSSVPPPSSTRRLGPSMVGHALLNAAVFVVLLVAD